MAYHEACRLGSQLERAYRIFPREQVHPVVLDDIRFDPAATWARLLDFLEIDQDGRREFDVVNPAKVVRSPTLQGLVMRAWSVKRALRIPVNFGVLTRVTIKNRRALPLSTPEHIREMLTSAFLDEIHKLEGLLQRDFSAWYGEASAAPEGARAHVSRGSF
jgi:hypothetical protein